ncbi:MAG: hypothetical protein DBW63_13615 [Hyphomonas sp.]|nr:MAG: hypothetical protein DBW63_13615 [Hyphomonas sp.]
MLAKLVESWLDSIGERGYQPAYCTLLLLEGHSILHNTRHSPIEIGKDIITEAPDGTRHLIQLKGNPGARFKQSDFATHANQLSTLCNTRWGPPLDGVIEKPYFVTNGEIEEEARVAFDQFNNGLAARGLKPLNLVSRGELLKRFLSAVEAISPSDPLLFSRFALLMVRSTNDEVQFQEIYDFFSAVIEIDKDLSSPAVTRNSAACLLLSELIASRYDNEGCVFETIKIRIAALCAIRSLHLKNNKQTAPLIASLYREFRQRILQSIFDLIEPLIGREQYFLDGPYVQDAIQIAYRREITSSLIAAALSDIDFSESTLDYSALNKEYHSSAIKIMRGALHDMQLWGERSAARYLIVYMTLSNSLGGGDADLHLRRMAYFYSDILKTKHGNFYPSVYYEYDEYVRNYVLPELSHIDDQITRETFLGHSSLFRAIFLLCARKNWKVTCKSVWSEFSKYLHSNVIPNETWQYCKRPNPDSTTNEHQYRDWELWPFILEQAEEHAAGEGFLFFDGDIFLLQIYLIICPDRADLDTILTLDRVLGDSINLQDRQKFRAIRK